MLALQEWFGLLTNCILVTENLQLCTYLTELRRHSLFEDAYRSKPLQAHKTNTSEEIKYSWGSSREEGSPICMCEFLKEYLICSLRMEVSQKTDR